MLPMEKQYMDTKNLKKKKENFKKNVWSKNNQNKYTRLQNYI